MGAIGDCFALLGQARSELCMPRTKRAGTGNREPNLRKPADWRCLSYLIRTVDEARHAQVRQLVKEALEAPTPEHLVHFLEDITCADDPLLT
jgi:hypothetical protein